MSYFSSAWQPALQHKVPRHIPRGSVFSGHGGYRVDPIGSEIQAKTCAQNTIVSSVEASPFQTAIEMDVRALLMNRAGFEDGGAVVLPTRTLVQQEVLRLARDRYLERRQTPSHQLALLAPDWDLKSWRDAAYMIGLDPRQVVPIVTDDGHRASLGTLHDAVRDAESKGLDPFFLSAQYGARGPGGGARDPIEVFTKEAAEDPALKDAWLHIEAGHGSDEVLQGNQSFHSSEISSVHLDAKKAGVSLPGSGHALLLQDFRDQADRMNLPESSNYLYHDELGEADQHFKDMKSLGLKSPLCTQTAHLTGLWLTLRLQDDMPTHRGRELAQQFVDKIQAAELPMSFPVGAEHPKNSLVAFEVGGARHLAKAALEECGIDFKVIKTKGRDRLLARFGHPSHSGDTVDYMVKSLKWLLSGKEGPKPIKPEALEIDLQIPNDQDYDRIYRDPSFLPSKAEVDTFFEEFNLDKPLTPLQKQDCLKAYNRLLHLGPGMSTHNHNQVGGYVNEISNRYVMDFLKNPPSKFEVEGAEADIVTFTREYFRALSPRGVQLVDSGTIANRRALVAAFQRLPDAQKREIDRLVAFVPETSHYSFDKAHAEILGLPEEHLIKVNVGPDQKMDLKDLEQKVAAEVAKGNIPYFVTGIYGTTTAGVQDDIQGMLKWSTRYNQGHKIPIWVHVDGAQGLFHLTETSMNGVDSYTVDYHKAGLVNNTLAAYISTKEEPHDFFQSVGKYHPNKVAGFAKYLQTISPDDTIEGAVDGFRSEMRRSEILADTFVEKMQEDPTCPFQLVAKGESNSMVCFTLKDKPTPERLMEWRSRAMKDQTGEGQSWASNLVQINVGEEIPALRVNFLNYSHNFATVEAVYEQLKQTAPGPSMPPLNALV